MASVEFRSGGVGGAYRRRVGDFTHESVHGTDEHGTRSGPGLGGRLGQVLNYIAAVVSVGLIVGLGVWGVRLVSRDVSGVPVIRAMVGESRVAPDDPGGRLAEDHIGMAVNAVPAGQGAAAEGDEVAIAPPGAGLTEQDLPMGEFGAEAMIPGALSDSIPDADAIDPTIAVQDSEIGRLRAEAEAAEAQAAAHAAALAARAEQEAQAATFIDAPASEAAINEAVTAIDGTQVDAGAISAAVAEANNSIQPAAAVQAPTPPGALMRSTRPATRPARTDAARSVATSPTATARPAAERPVTPPAEQAPARAAPPPPAPAQQAAAPVAGAAIAQIGAFDSDAIARSEWNRIAGRAGGLFNGKGQIVQRHESNGRVFYRLRVAGFGSSSEAQKFCSDLKALGTDCLAIKVN